MRDDITIEPLDPADIELVGPLWKQLMDHVASLPDALVPVRPSDESWELERAEMLRELAGEAFVLVARKDGRVVGYAFVCIEGPDPVWYTGDKHAMLATLCVDEAERGDGIGGALLDAVDAELERRGVEDVEIGVDTGNEVAARLYERRGYRADFRIFYGSRAASRGRACGARPRTGRPGAAASRRPARTRSAHERPAASTVERVDPAGLDELRPLWEALLVRHAEVWSVATAAARRRDVGAAPAAVRRLARRRGLVRPAGPPRRAAPSGTSSSHVGEGDETYATGERLAEIHTLVVAAGERDAGVGGLLFDAAMEELGRLGVDDLLVGAHGRQRGGAAVLRAPRLHALRPPALRQAAWRRLPTSASRDGRG